MTDYCTVNVKYIYTVTNVGPTTENINILSRALNVNVKDLTSAWDTIELVPGNDVVTTEIVSIDICQEEKKISGYDEVYATSPSGTIFDDTTVYEFDGDKVCNVEVETECVFSDDSNNYCRSIPLDEDPEDCGLWVYGRHSYIVINASPTPHTVDKLVRNFNGNYNDMT